MIKRALQRTSFSPTWPVHSRSTIRARCVMGTTGGRLLRLSWLSVFAGLIFLFSVAGARAADIVIRMLDTSKDGPLAFEPSFVKANVGDTLVFTPSSKGHSTESLLVPDGSKSWKSGYGKETRVTVAKEGVYLYGCKAHRRMGMVGVVQVGRPVNLEEAKKAAATASSQFVMNKERFTSALRNVH